MSKVYHTDDIDSFISLHGFAGAVDIVAKALDISLDQARERVKLAQKHGSNAI